MAASVQRLVEGDRYTLTAAVTAPRRASKVTLQKFNAPDYDFQDPEWVAVRTIRVNNRRTLRFPVVATEKNVERYRAVVTYNRIRTVTSKPVAVTVWRWIPLDDYDPYYQSEQFGMAFGTTTINGQAYPGWGAVWHSHTGTWESRFTPGRHCNAFRGVFGLDDASADETSGVIAIDADDVTVHQTSPLTPGMAAPTVIALPTKPYRFAIRLADTTPGNTTNRDTNEAFPVIGAPALLCTGV